MKKKMIFLLALSVLLATAVTMNSTLAYFTTYAEAKGGYVVELGDTHIEETFSGWTHRVVITSDSTSQPVYVRAKAFAGNACTLTYSGNGWELGSDGFHYYDTILYGGEATTEFLVTVGDIPEGAKPGDGFNVVVIYETTPVLYDEAGNPYADWTQRLAGGNGE